MPTRTVNLSEEAYDRLKALKREGESFSEVVNRITGKHALRDLVGVLDPEAAERLRGAADDLSDRLRASLDDAADRMGRGA